MRRLIIKIFRLFKKKRKDKRIKFLKKKFGYIDYGSRLWVPITDFNLKVGTCIGSSNYEVSDVNKFMKDHEFYNYDESSFRFYRISSINSNYFTVEYCCYYFDLKQLIRTYEKAVFFADLIYYKNIKFYQLVEFKEYNPNSEPEDDCL